MAGEALFLVGPNDTMYAVAMWPSGEWLLDWSPEGRRVLSFRDGALRITDLRDGTTVVVPNDLYGISPNEDEDGWARWARFTRPTGRDIVVRLLDWGDRIRLECLHTDGTRFAQLADLDISSYDYTDLRSRALGITQLTWLYAPTGTEVVVATTEGIRLLTNLGAVIRPLDSPGLGCSLSRWWDERSVLAACHDPDWAASPCWTRGQVGPGGGRSLWSVPLDGSPAPGSRRCRHAIPSRGRPSTGPSTPTRSASEECSSLKARPAAPADSSSTSSPEAASHRGLDTKDLPRVRPTWSPSGEGGLVVFETAFGGAFGTVFQVVCRRQRRARHHSPGTGTVRRRATGADHRGNRTLTPPPSATGWWCGAREPHGRGTRHPRSAWRGDPATDGRGGAEATGRTFGAAALISRTRFEVLPSAGV